MSTLNGYTANPLSSMPPQGYRLTMRCRLCGDPAGWLRVRCLDCRRLWTTWQAHRGGGLRQVLDGLFSVGVEKSKIERFLHSEPLRGKGTVLDHIAAEMANQLLGALGQKAQQDAEQVRRLRERGLWRWYNRRPSQQ